MLKKRIDLIALQTIQIAICQTKEEASVLPELLLRPVSKPSGA
jgi:hypothetical protein